MLALQNAQCFSKPRARGYDPPYKSQSFRIFIVIKTFSHQVWFRDIYLVMYTTCLGRDLGIYLLLFHFDKKKVCESANVNRN